MKNWNLYLQSAVVVALTGLLMTLSPPATASADFGCGICFTTPTGCSTATEAQLDYTCNESCGGDAEDYECHGWAQGNVNCGNEPEGTIYHYVTCNSIH